MNFDHMPDHHSIDVFDEAVVKVIEFLQPKEVLDIGAGGGKWGFLIRRSALPEQPRLTGLDPSAECEPRLRNIGYDDVIIGVADDLYDAPEKNYDTVILGDVIEHMRKSEGRDLLEFLLYRSAYIIIITPEAMPMSGSPFYIGHNCIWRPEALAFHDLWAHGRHNVMYLYILRGHLDWGKVKLSALVDGINALSLLVRNKDRPESNGVLSLKIHDSVTRDPWPGRDDILTIYRPE